MKAKKAHFKSSQFGYNAANKTFSNIASTLGFRAETPLPAGIVICSSRTSVEVEYVFARTVKDEEGDIQWWEYLPTPTSLRRVPNALATSVKIFNT